MSLWWRVSDAFQTGRPRRIIPSEGGSKLGRARRWRNGRLDALKTHCPKGRVGSNPTRRTRFMRSHAEYKQAVQLIGRGFNDCEVAAALGIPRTTVRDWRYRCTAERRLMIREGCATCGQAAHDFASLPGPSHAYVLGMYLGDGDISRLPRTWRLRISLDMMWPGIMVSCANAMQAVFPDNRVSLSRADPVRDSQRLLQASHLPVPAARPRPQASPSDRAVGLANGLRS
jgi:hypothetical protein